MEVKLKSGLSGSEHKSKQHKMLQQIRPNKRGAGTKYYVTVTLHRNAEHTTCISVPTTEQINK